MTYEYRHVNVISVVDGDTVRLIIDLGNKIHWTDNFRLNGIDTPEKKQLGYEEAKEYLKSLLASGIDRVETHKPDKFGRWLIDIWVHGVSGILHVNQLMVINGHAKPYFGGAK